MTTPREGNAPDEWQCRVFVTVARTKGTGEAAAVLTARRGRTYNRQSVEKVIRILDAWYGTPLLQRVGRRLELTEAGRAFYTASQRILTEYDLMRRGPHPTATTAPPVVACHAHHAPLVAAAHGLLCAGGSPSPPRFTTEFLMQRDQSEAAFHQQAMVRLRDHVYDVVIGPPVDHDGLRSTRLYQAHLEAMVAADHPEPVIPLIDLVTRYRLLLPPPGVRSRDLLERTVDQLRTDDPHRDVRVVAESYETAASVMRLRHDAPVDHRSGHVVVATSDVSIAFKPGMEFHGHNAERFTWVPIVHPDAAGGPLVDDVCAISRDRDERARPVVEALRQAAARLGRDPGSGGPAVPLQRRPT